MILSFVALIVVILVYARLTGVQDEVRRLNARIDDLEAAAERAARRAATALSQTKAPAEPFAPTAPQQQPVSPVSIASTASPQWVVTSTPKPAETPTPEPAPEPVTPVTPVTPRVYPRPGRFTDEPEPETAWRFDSAKLEQLVGGIWLQNIGSVLLLLGVFLMIVWGYTSGRLGAGALVAAGIGLGVALVWRGDRLSRRVPAFGHALIGVGLGVVYLTIYLGHVRLAVFEAKPALGLLFAAAALTVGMGMRYRVQAIAALGIAGAFLPPFLAVWLGIRGFALPPALLLGYLAVVDALVFVLAARSGWSGLALAAVLLSAGAWITNVHVSDWSWGIQIGLCALFTTLGLAPVPRLSRTTGSVHNVDLAVVAVAPICLIAASAPWLMIENRLSVAMLALALGSVYLAVALWVDARRPDQDLWRPLVAAAVVFATVALERAFGHEHTPLAWTVEGVTLIVLGLRDRGGWLRACGTVVTALAVWWMLYDVVELWPHPGSLPVFNADGIRSLIGLLLVLGLALLLARRRERLTELERWTPEIWTALGHGLLLLWLGREAYNTAYAFYDSSGRWRMLPTVGMPSSDRLTELQVWLTAAIWMAQALALTRQGIRRSSPFLRALAIPVGGAAVIAASAGHFISDGWGHDRLPVLHVPSLLFVATIAMAVAAAMTLASRRHALSEQERHLPEVWGAAACLGMLLWSSREAHHTAQAFYAVGGRWFVPTAGVSMSDRLTELAIWLTVAVWMAQSFALTLLGLRRSSGFLRMLATLVGCAVMIGAMAGAALQDTWGFDRLPVWHAPSLLLVTTIALAIASAMTLASRREALGPWERRLPEVWAAAACLGMILWSTREAYHLARTILSNRGAFAPDPNALQTLSAALTSGAWVLQAVALLLMGWARGSGFLRWCGLGLFGITLLKFLVVDLSHVDVFWRFLTAIATGTAMLLISYLYQVRQRRAGNG